MLELKAKSEGVKNQGVAIANARAKAEAEEIKFRAALKNAELRAKARKIEKEAALDSNVKRQTTLLEHEKKMNDLEIFR